MIITIDAKMTVWERFTIDTDLSIEEVKQAVKNSYTGDDTMYIGDILESETLFDVSEYISPEDNGNQSTVELVDADNSYQAIATNESLKDLENEKVC